MSKALYVYSRTSCFDEAIEKRLLQICKELTPDNVTSSPVHRVFIGGQTAYAVTLINDAFHEYNSSMFLGYLFEEPNLDWSVPQQCYPDGNYALFRNGDDKIEIVSDAAGSRTIWYYQDDDLFVASTSQRAIILFIGTFVFDERVVPWLLSTGALGPELSWDKRIKRLQPDSRVLLDKKTWNLALTRNEVSFSPQHRTRRQHKELLENAIRQTIQSMASLEFNRWVLPLSGGYDSRSILCFLKQQVGVPEGLKAVTWGLQRSLTETDNDAAIARTLATSQGVPHYYYHTDTSSDPIETIIDRFLFCGEGRIDHLPGYMDGMEIWRRFHDQRTSGVIRGDEGFGWSPVSSELTARLSLGCALCTDFENLNGITKTLGLRVQGLPSSLERRQGESLNEWRDRLYHAYRMPTILAALADIKLSYVEQICPLLSSAILRAVRTLPDRWRTDKRLFREIVKAIGPAVPFAKKGANADHKDILKNPAIVQLLKREIDSAYANQLFGPKFVNYVLEGIKADTGRLKNRRQKIVAGLTSRLPRCIKNWLRDKALPPSVEGNVLAFRVFIILKMNKILEASAAEFGRNETKGALGDVGSKFPVREEINARV